MIKSKRQLNIVIIDCFVALSVIAAVATFVFCSGIILDCMGIIAILPLVFLVGYLVLRKNLFNHSTVRITIGFFLGTQFIRLVLLPFFGAISGYFSDYTSTYGVEVNASTQGLAVWAIIIEAIMTTAFCFFLTKVKEYKEEYQGSFEIKGTYILYGLFILVGLVMYILSGRDMFHFIAFDTSSDRVSQTLLDGVGSTSRAIISYALTCLIILILYTCYRAYQRKNKVIYVIIALFTAMLRISIISSEGRMSQLYLIGCFLIVLPRLFADHKKLIVRSVLLISVIVIALMTVYKTFYAYLYDSYYEAIQAHSIDAQFISSQLDIYFYGIKTMARNLSFATSYSTSFSQPFFDFARSTFGLHYFVKSSGLTTIQQYNQFLYNGLQVSGHLLSSTAYGYSYVGLILAPLATCVNILACAITERIMRRWKNLDVYYINCIILMRLEFTIFASYMASWGYVSRTIVIGAAVILGSSILRLGRKK